MSDRDDEVRRGYPGDSADPEVSRDGHGGDAELSDFSPFPADLAAVQADDALLDVLRGADPRVSPSDEQLAGVLLQWRHEVDAEPIGELIDTDTAMELVAGTEQRPGARRQRRRRNPVLLPFAAAAALAVIAFSGVGLAAKSAEPDDALFRVTQVLYPQHAASVEAANTVETQLDTARTALNQGRDAAAKDALDRAEQDLPAVSDAERHNRLAEQRDDLLNRLSGQPEQRDEQVPPGVPAATSSSQQPSESAVPQPDSSESTEQPEPSPTTPQDGETSTSQPDPSSEPAPGTADAPQTGSQSYSTAPGGRSTPDSETGDSETGASDTSVNNSAQATGAGTVSGTAGEPRSAGAVGVAAAAPTDPAPGT